MQEIMLNTIGNKLNSLQLRELKRFGARIDKFGVNFAAYHGDDELVMLCAGGGFESNRERLIKCGMQTLKQSQSEKGEPCIYEEGLVLGARLNAADNGSEFVVLIELCDNLHNGEFDAQPRCVDAHVKIEYLKEMLTLFSEKFQTECKAERQIETVSTELAQVYEELVLLYKLSTNMKVTEPDANFLQMACDSLTDIIDVEGIAVLMDKMIDNDNKFVLVAGSGLIDINDQMVADLHERMVTEINSGKEALLDSEVDSPFRYDWSDNIRNIIAVPLQGKDKRGSQLADRTRNGNRIIGLMVATNRIHKADFDSIDVKLFNSVANGCAAFIENGRLFNDLKELFIGSLRALTSSIDAKDQYTRGHSERVAFISRWIAEKAFSAGLLEEEQVHKIYLAGLLHDIGKMGVDGSVLRKEGKLTAKELKHVQAHPAIGANILGQIKQMRDVVPGILCHHERVDGKGYPNGVSGEQIPALGKIIGLADSFDAMTSERTYRQAMSVEKAMAEIEKGLGTQFDETFGRLFLDSDVYQLWDSINGKFNQMCAPDNLSEYGSVAVGALIK